MEINAKGGWNSATKKGDTRSPFVRRCEPDVYCRSFWCVSASRFMRATTLKPKNTNITMASTTITMDSQVTESQVRMFMVYPPLLLKQRTTAAVRTSLTVRADH